MPLRYVQCILFVAHKEKIPDLESGPILRKEMSVYAVVPRVQFYDVLFETLTSRGIKVLDSLIDPLLLEAEKSNRVSDIEVILRKDEILNRSRILTVYTKLLSKKLVERAFVGLCRIECLMMWFVLTRNETKSIGLLDDNSFTTIKKLRSGVPFFKDYISVCHPPVKKFDKPTNEKFLYLHTYSGQDVITMLENRGEQIIEKDARNPELLSGAIALDRPDLIKTMLKWGAAVHCRDSLSGPNGLIINLLWTASLHRSFRSFKFLSKLDDSWSPELDLHDLVTDIYLKKGLTVAHEMLSSRGLNLDLAKAGRTERLAVEHVEIVRALDLSINKSFVQNTRRLREVCYEESYSLAELVKSLEFPPSEYLTEQVAMMKLKMVGDTDISFYDIMSADVRKIVLLMGNNEAEKALICLSDLNLFPTYRPMIQWRVRKALYRRKLLKQGLTMFNFLFKQSPDLLEGIKEEILGYLSNLDLIVFVNICKLPVSESS